MSRIGRKPVAVPKNVKVAFQNGELKVEGPKGKLSFRPHKAMKVKVDGGNIVIERADEERMAKSVHGLTRTLIANMVNGAEKGFTRELDINGVGYRAEVKGKDLHMTLGFSHPVVFKLPEGVTAQVTDEKKTHIILSSADKQVLGATAAKIRSFRPVTKDPYGAKGVRYSDERVKRKEGKSGAK
jgi:large subunit ribosomal protein L6